MKSAPPAHTPKKQELHGQLLAAKTEVVGAQGYREHMDEMMPQEMLPCKVSPLRVAAWLIDNL